MVHLLTVPAPDPWYGDEIRMLARILLLTAEALPAPDRPAAIEQLRRALVEAGEVDLARTTAKGPRPAVLARLPPGTGRSARPAAGVWLTGQRFCRSGAEVSARQARIPIIGPPFRHRPSEVSPGHRAGWLRCRPWSRS